jgi:hypothetical protein
VEWWGSLASGDLQPHAAACLRRRRDTPRLDVLTVVGGTRLGRVHIAARTCVHAEGPPFTVVCLLGCPPTPTKPLPPPPPPICFPPPTASLRLDEVINGIALAFTGVETVLGVVAILTLVAAQRF